MFNFKDMMQQVQGLQSKVAQVQERLAEQTVVGSAGGDMVRVEVTGTQEVVSVKIEKELTSSDDVEMLESLIAAAVNDALAKSRELMAQEMGKVTGGLRIPGLTS